MKFDYIADFKGKPYFMCDGREVAPVTEMFPKEQWDDPRAFKMAGIRGYEPMTAKELDTEEVQNQKLSSTDYFVEEKFDGTRALIYFLSQEDYNTKEPMGFCRVFSRRISEKTGFYVENTDSLPHLREIDVPDLAGTILDGEMFIDGLPFKEVSSTLNCLWDKAVSRQIEKGFITLHAFDILFYKGIDLRKMPLKRRKVYLHLAIQEAGSPYITEVPYYSCGKDFDLSFQTALKQRGITDEDKEEAVYAFVYYHQDSFPTLFNYYESGDEKSFTPRAYYELIVATGGEGVIVKPTDGKYLHKRGWEYSKIKKFLTRELVVLGFSEPTKEYTGKNLNKWGFWVDNRTGKRVLGNFAGDMRYSPVTKYYYYNQVGNLLLGVFITREELEKIPEKKRGEAYPPYVWFNPPLAENRDYLIMQVCECAGYDEETRAVFSQNREAFCGKVVEVKANELFRDTGKMRHPRFLRIREDKSPLQCTWADHVGTSEVTT